VGLYLVLIIILSSCSLGESDELIVGHVLGAVELDFAEAVAFALLDVEDKPHPAKVAFPEQLARDAHVVKAEGLVIFDELGDVALDHGGVVLAAEQVEKGA